jgi:uncharacterized protein (TIGR00369 family)
MPTLERTQLIERREKIVQWIYKNARIVPTYGKRFLWDEKDQAIVELPYNKAFDNGLGGVHGSVYSMLIDNAGWFAACPYYDTWISTIEFNVKLLEPAKEQDLYGIGTVVKLGKKVATSTMEVRTSEGLLVAIGSGTFAVSSIKLDL